MVRHTFAFLFTLVQISLCAQVDFRPGYVIKVNGDSLSGLVAYPNTKKSGSVCYLKLNKESETEQLSTSDLLAYGINNDKRFEAKQIFTNGKVESIFLEVLVKGVVSLYLNRNVFYYEQDTLVELPPGKQPGSSYVDVLNLLLKECNLSANDTRYVQRELINLIQNYNRCQAEAGLVFTQDLPKTRVNYQLYGGVTFSTLSMESFGDISFNPSTGAFLGASAEVSLPRANERLFYSIEFNYYKSLFQGYRESLDPTSVRSDFIINMSLLRVPIGVRYNFFSDYNSPYLKGGVVGAFNAGSTYKNITETENSGTVTTTVNEGKLDSKTQFGFWIGAGYQRAVSGRYKLYIEMRVEKMNGYLYGDFQTPIDNNNLNILLGLRY